VAPRLCEVQHKDLQDQSCDRGALDDASSRGGDLAESMDVRHDIVSALLLLDSSDLKLRGREALRMGGR
jgi:hypothetical protein